MKKKLSITATLILAMFFSIIILPHTALANMFMEWTPMTQDNCVIIGDNNLPLRVRATPGGKIIGSLKIGTQIPVYNAVSDRKGNYWTKIKFGRHFGYVSTDYVSCG